jgi:hypothetical protein
MKIHVKISSAGGWSIKGTIHVGTQPSFEKTLFIFGPLLDFDTLVEEGVPKRS